MVKQITEAHVLAALSDIDFPLNAANEWCMESRQIAAMIYRDSEAGREEVKAANERMPKLPSFTREDSGAVYPLRFVLDYLRMINKLGATHVKISSERNSPLVMLAAIQTTIPNPKENEVASTARTIEFVLAPRIDSGDEAQSIVIKKPEAKLEAAKEEKKDERRWAEAVLKNDETGTDESLIEYFMKEGKMSKEKAKFYVGQRARVRLSLDNELKEYVEEKGEG